MGLRIATIDDMDELMGMALKFAKASNYADYVEEDKIRAFIEQLVLSDVPEVLMLLHEGQGMLAAMAQPFIFGKPMLATEICWWVEPDARTKGVGKELMEAYEFWAKKLGCTMLTMSCLDDLLGKYYEKNGYSLYERVYFKEIK